MIDWIIDKFLILLGIALVAILIFVVAAMLIGHGGPAEPQPYAGQERHQVYACRTHSELRAVPTGKSVGVVVIPATSCQWEDLPQ